MFGKTTLGEKTPGKRWFAVRVRPRQEHMVAANLLHKSYEVFLPLYQSRRSWSDRIKVIELPLFPGYIFCRFDLADKASPVVTTPGVIRLLGNAEGPEAVSDEEIEATQQIVASKLKFGAWPYLKAGTPVRVRSGPLAGIEGLVLATKSQTRLIVSVTLLGRSVAVDIDQAFLTALSDRVEAPVAAGRQEQWAAGRCYAAQS